MKELLIKLRNYVEVEGYDGFGLCCLSLDMVEIELLTNNEANYLREYLNKEAHKLDTYIFGYAFHPRSKKARMKWLDRLINSF